MGLAMALRCKRCGSEEHVKNGFMKGLQRYRCKACGLNFTAKLLGVSTPSVMAWIEQFAKAYAQKPEPEGRAVVVELDEMWHFLKKRPTNSGSGRLGIVLQAEWLTGSAGGVTPPPSHDYSSASSVGASASTVPTTGRPTAS